MKNRFDLEEEISSLYNFSDQLGTLSEGILEHQLTHDEITNVLEGLKIMLNLKTQKLFDTMCQCFNLDQYNDESSIV